MGRRKGTFGNLLPPIDQVLIVHYACLSFTSTVTPPAPRIVVIRSPATNSDIVIEDQKERVVLGRLISELKSHKQKHWIHWNMGAGDQWGWKALAQLAQKNGLKLTIPPNADLSHLLWETLGNDYIAVGGRGRLWNLAELNNVPTSCWMDGKDEANQIASGNIAAVVPSTRAKTKAIEGIYRLCCLGNLMWNNQPTLLKNKNENDPYMPYWKPADFKKNYGIPPSRLRKARAEGRLMAKRVGSQWQYSRPDAKRLWPFDVQRCKRRQS